MLFALRIGNRIY